MWVLARWGRHPDSSIPPPWAQLAMHVPTPGEMPLDMAVSWVVSHRC